MSQLSCFLEILVQLRSRETGCRRMMPLSIRGVMDLQWFKSIRVHNRLSQHLMARPAQGESSEIKAHVGSPTYQAQGQAPYSTIWNPLPSAPMCQNLSNNDCHRGPMEGASICSPSSTQ